MRREMNADPIDSLSRLKHAAELRVVVEKMPNGSRKKGTGHDRSIPRTSGRHAYRQRGTSAQSATGTHRGRLKDHRQNTRNVGYGNPANSTSRTEFAQFSSRHSWAAILHGSPQGRHSNNSQARKSRSLNLFSQSPRSDDFLRLTSSNTENPNFICSPN